MPEAHSADLSIVCHLSLVKGLQAAVHAIKARPRFRRAYAHATLSPIFTKSPHCLSLALIAGPMPIQTG